MKQFMKGQKRARGGGESELEYLRGKNKELMKEVKKLRKQLEAIENYYSEEALKNVSLKKRQKAKKAEADDESSNQFVEKNTLCPECNAGELELVIIEAPFKTFKFHICAICNHRIKLN